MKRSEHICGRRENILAFEAAQAGGKCFVVGAYPVIPKNYAPTVQRTMYSGVSFIGSRDGCTTRTRKRTGCPYRIIVTPKPLTVDKTHAGD